MKPADSTTFLEGILIDAVPQTAQLRLVRFQLDGDFSYLPGQYAIVRIGSGQGYFAFANRCAQDGRVEFLIKDGPAGTPAHELFTARVADGARISPAMGPGYPIHQIQNKILWLVGVGSAISPLRAVLQEVEHSRDLCRTVNFVYGARKPEDIPFRDELDHWALRFQVHRTVSAGPVQGWDGPTGRVTEILRTLKPDPDDSIVFLCGMKEMIADCRAILKGLGFQDEQILLNF